MTDRGDGDEARTLQQAIQYFSDEQVCIDAVAVMRWPDGLSRPAILSELEKHDFFRRSPHDHQEMV
jgi:hypothetical protein